MDLTNSGRAALRLQTVGFHYDRLTDVSNELSVMCREALFREEDGVAYQLAVMGDAVDAVRAQFALFSRNALLMPGDAPEVPRGSN